MIKEQCDKCQKFGTDDCGFQVEFNNCSCEQYSCRSDLEKQPTADSPELVATPYTEETTEAPYGSDQNAQNNTVITAEYLKENTEIGGWLSFFLLCMCAGSVASIILFLLQFNSGDYKGSTLLALSDFTLGIMLCSLSFYTLYSFIQRKPDAVYLGKLYIVTTFLTNLLLLLNGNYAATGLGSLPQIIRSLTWSAIWYAFLCISTGVEEVIPKSYRKKTAKDYYITIALYLIPILLIATGIGSLITSRMEQEAKFIETVRLSSGEYTDGRIIFKAPEGFSCERHELETPKLTLFTLECADVGDATLCSDYDTDMSQKRFNTYWGNWENEDAKQLASHVECFEKHQIGERTYWYKVTRYEANSIVYWRFILLYDSPSGKVCVISGYDTGHDNYIKELLESIRFQ